MNNNIIKRQKSRDLSLPGIIRKQEERIKNELEKARCDTDVEMVELDHFQMKSCSLPELHAFQNDEIEPMDIDVFKIVDEKASKSPNKVPKFRPIVIDGLNICYAYKNNGRLDAEGLKVTYNCLKKMGFEDQNIIFILKHIPRHYKKDCEIAEEFHQKGVLYYAPSRKIQKGNYYIQSDDDLFILKTAKELNGVILSNDQFRKQKTTHPEYSDIIDKGLIMPRFIGNKLILPDDPLGPDGPSLDQMLKRTEVQIASIT